MFSSESSSRSIRARVEMVCANSRSSTIRSNERASAARSSTSTSKPFTPSSMTVSASNREDMTKADAVRTCSRASGLKPSKNTDSATPRSFASCLSSASKLPLPKTSSVKSGWDLWNSANALIVMPWFFCSSKRPEVTMALRLGPSKGSGTVQDDRALFL